MKTAIGRLKATPINKLTQGIEPRGRPKEVLLAAIVSSIRERALKNGSGRMAILQLEDLSGQCEGVVFSKEYSAHEELLRSDLPLLFNGTVVIEDDENPVPKLRIREVSQLKEATSKNTSQVHFYLEADNLTEKDLQTLKKILNRHKGKCNAFLHIRIANGKTETVLRLPNQVSFSEKVEQEVNGLFRKQITEYC